MVDIFMELFLVFFRQHFAKRNQWEVYSFQFRVPDNFNENSFLFEEIKGFVELLNFDFLLLNFIDFLGIFFLFSLGEFLHVLSRPFNGAIQLNDEIGGEFNKRGDNA